MRRFALTWIAALAACAEQEEAPAPPPASPLPGVILGSITVSPEVALPGATVRVTARFPAGTPDVPLCLIRPDAGGAEFGVWRGEGNERVAEVEVALASNWGLQALAVQACTEGEVVLAAWGSVIASTHPACPAGEVLDGGACHPKADGHALVVQAFAQVSAGHPTGTAPDDTVRTMLHPRQLVRLGNATVGCHSDHIGIVWLGDFAAAGVTPPRVEGDSEDGVTPRTETLFADVHAELAYCENFALVRHASPIGVTAHRGTDKKLGGLATWRIPDVTTPLCNPCTARFDAPELMDLELDANGFEGVLADGDVLYAAKKPNRLAIFRVETSGSLTALADLEVPELRSAWNLAKDGSTLYLSDPSAYTTGVLTEGPDGTAHYAHLHEPADGRLFTIDVSDPALPVPLGWGATSGASKTLAVLPEKHVAVANGAAGVELFDASDPAQPVAAPDGSVDTPGAATDLSYAAGHLLVADWDNIRLYDASQRGVLRLLDACDLSDFGSVILEAERAAMGPGPLNEDDLPTFGAPIAMAFAQLQPDGSFFANDLDRIFVGQVRRGAAAPRLLVQDSRISVKSGPGSPEASISIRVANGGATQTWVMLETSDTVLAPEGGLVLGPGHTGELKGTLLGLDQAVPEEIALVTSDPFPARRTVQIHSVQGQYNVGDPAPRISVPAINWCTGGSCELEARCVDTYAEPEKNRPILMAVFTSW